MVSRLPLWAHASNCATAAPAVFSLLATVPDGRDSCRTILRGDTVTTCAAAWRHALVVLDSLSMRHGQVDVQLFADGVPVAIVSAGDGGAL